ncbi:MAG: hypothetical protein IPK53_12495 [bacterium]|nr:hypothetical protein [bacterium]
MPQGNGIVAGPAAPRLIEIWQGIAERYAAREVNAGLRSDEMNRGPVIPPCGTYAIQGLIDGIRVIDPGHIITVENTLDGELFRGDPTSRIFSIQPTATRHLLVTHAAAAIDATTPCRRTTAIPAMFCQAPNG